MDTNGRYLTLDGRAVDQRRMEERATEIHCRLVVDEACVGTPEARDVEEELLDELIQLEAALRTEESAGRARNFTERGRTL